MARSRFNPNGGKALEMIGEGATSLQLASALELGALDASLTALAMTKAGLLIVSEVDPLDISLGDDLAIPPTEGASTTSSHRSSTRPTRRQ